MAVTVIDSDELVRRNAEFAASRSFAGLTLRPALRAGVFVSGLVYDVATGLIETVVPPTRVTA